MNLSEFRTASFRRNEALEALLSQLSSDLHPAEDRLVSGYRQKTMPYPVVLVMGPLRSGTTLFMQWLANTGIVAYPTNMLSRFYRAPIIGARVQLLLTDPRYNFRDELGDFSRQIYYASENGKTKGLLAPNEFWYFWRRFLPEQGRDVWTDDELLLGMDVETMLAELVGIMDVFKRPFAAKGMLFNYNIPFLNSVLENALFIQIKRNPIANIASVLEARKRQLGSESAWYSFKIPEYKKLKDLDPITQSTGQICSINRAVTSGMSKLVDSRKLLVEYEDFCLDPRRTFENLVDKLGLPRAQWSYNGPVQFKVRRISDISQAKAIMEALSFLTYNKTGYDTHLML